MFDYLRRLATTGVAYTAASVASKVLAVLLLPLYTSHLSTADYGQAELLFSTVVAASIIIRLGLIEALLRFFYLPDERGDEVVATGLRGAVLDRDDRRPDRAAVRRPDRRAAERRGARSRPGPDRDRRALGADPLRVHGHPLPPRRARQGLLRLHDRQRAAGDPADGAAGRRLRRGRRGAPGRQLPGGPALPAPADLGRALPTVAAARPRPAAADDPLRAADDAGRDVDLLARVHRPDHHRPLDRARRARPLRPRLQVQPGDPGRGPRLPARLAAARLLDPRRRGGAAHLRGRRHRVHGALRVHRRRHVAGGALDRPAARRRPLLRCLRGDRPARPRRGALRDLPGPGRDPRPDRKDRATTSRSRSWRRSPT